jgi:hypothetical protein
MEKSIPKMLANFQVDFVTAYENDVDWLGRRANNTGDCCYDTKQTVRDDDN